MNQAPSPSPRTMYDNHPHDMIIGVFGAPSVGKTTLMSAMRGEADPKPTKTLTFQVWGDSPWHQEAPYSTPYHLYTFNFWIALCRTHHKLPKGTKK